MKGTVENLKTRAEKFIATFRLSLPQIPGAEDGPARKTQTPSPNPIMEKSLTRAEKADRRIEKVEAKVLALEGVMAKNGSVRSYWKNYHGQKLGPYFRLVYHDSGRRHSLYLGNSKELAERVERLLDELHRDRRERLWSRKFRAQIRASLRREKAKLNAMLEPLGIRMKGYAFYQKREVSAKSP